jgi:hypothetical protein
MIGFDSELIAHLLVPWIVTFETEKERARPTGTGDETCDLGKALVAIALVLEALGIGFDNVDLVLPFSYEASPRLDWTSS